MNEFLSARRLLLASVLLVVVAMAAALYLQYAVGLSPCPLCVIQRMGFIAAALLALLAAIAGAGGIPRLALATLAIISAIAGGGVAAWHAWLLAHPPETLGCGRPFEMNRSAMPR